ncbi:type I 3-dehydroquinate dehydratase [Isobaculum melis]|uniref:3-dehydroquinate dehydratase n=1 Tax=Isobaculum melis TaxID=142588 RepID=A0A1H9U646_9LACT|nr:type I 3-dehydroquinate dehydratase [Isobaculum melis]SES04926.1 3-dehydroquinate dehydratase [Isobaculum melis]
MKTVTVKNVTLGEGAPKICVPMVGKTAEALCEEAKMLLSVDLDIIEWRVDFFEQVTDLVAVEAVAKEIRALLPETPILFTFRTKKEGGEREVPTAYYFELNQTMIQSQLVDLVDIELFMGDEQISESIQLAKENAVKVVMCNHDFDKTPAKEEIVSRLCRMQTLQADICKIAVMPQSTQDVLTLLDATNTMKEQHANRPIITMSMGGIGVISRLAGETFGSAMTFGAAKQASAPGQVSVNSLRTILDVLHESV